MKRILLSICFLAIGLWASAGDMSNSIELTQLYIIGDAPHTLGIWARLPTCKR